jgi:Cu(I)-responsive transcriptional regulator
MNIGEAAAATGLSAKTIRYYEDIGFVLPRRAENGYRDYGPEHVRFLRFVARARGLGFSVDDCRSLLALWRDRARASAEVRRIAHEHLSRIDEKIAELAEMRHTLSHLVDRCHGNDRPDCPIIDELAQAPAATPSDVAAQPQARARRAAAESER